MHPLGPFKRNHKLLSHKQDDFVSKLNGRLYDILWNQPSIETTATQRADFLHHEILSQLKRHGKLKRQAPPIPHAAWRSKKCQDLRKTIAQKLRTNPKSWWDPHVTELRKQYSTMRQAEDIKHYAACSRKLLKQAETGDRSFWQQLRKAKTKLQLQDQDKWYDYIQQLYHSKDARHQQTYPLPMADSMDFFTGGQVAEAIRSMDLHKAADEYGLTADILKSLNPDVLCPVLANKSNDCIAQGRLPEAWGVSYLIPIFKAGSVLIPSNYRLITITHLLAKIMAATTEQLLAPYLFNPYQNLQAGFKKGRAAIDHIFVSRILIESRLLAGQKVYACYVDLAKVFDKVCRAQLWRTLEKLGINPTLRRAIQMLYERLHIKVKLQYGYTPSCPSNAGLGQGGHLSPQLFAIVMQRLEELLATAQGCDPLLITPFVIHALFYAGDIVLFSHTSKGLEKQLLILQRFCYETGLTVNLDKSGILIYGGEEQEAEFYWEGCITKGRSL